MSRTHPPRTGRVPAHPGFTLPDQAYRQLQSTMRTLRRVLSPKADYSELVNDRAQQVMLDGLHAVESVLDLHLAAKPATRGVPASRRVRLAPSTIGALAQLRYALSYAIGAGPRHNEPDMNWQQYRAYVHSESAVKLVSAVLRQHRAARAGGPILSVAV